MGITSIPHVSPWIIYSFKSTRCYCRTIISVICYRKAWAPEWVFTRGLGPQIKLNLTIVMLKRVCSIVVIVVSYNPVLYQFYMCGLFVLARKCAPQWKVWIIPDELLHITHYIWFVMNNLYCPRFIIWSTNEYIRCLSVMRYLLKYKWSRELWPVALRSGTWSATTAITKGVTFVR